MKAFLILLAALALALQLAACGGGSSSSPGATSAPAGISGVSTPKSVSVVTAN